MNKLSIFTTDDLCAPTEENMRFGHFGTHDRDNPGLFYDHPGKTDALIKAAHLFRDTLIARDRQGQAPSVSLTVSVRVPERRELLNGHPEAYLTALESASQEARLRVESGGNPIAPFGKEADVSPGTYCAAVRSVGAALDAVDHIVAHTDTAAFALVWPPGHHAEPAQAMGFCYLSTAAIAALYARDHVTQLHTGRKNRVVLIDIDHHHGNGSAAVLADQDAILFIDQAYKASYDHAKKRYTDGTYNEREDRYIGAAREYPYPFDDTSLGITAHKIVTGANVVTLELEGSQSADTILCRFIADMLPRITSFAPDIVIWSVGLDSAKGDPLGGLGLEPESFYTLIKGLRCALPFARHCGILEGGYDPAISAVALVSTLRGFHEDLTTTSASPFERYRSLFTSMLQASTRVS